MSVTFLLGLLLLIVVGFFVFVLLRQQMGHLRENVEASSRLVHQQLSQLTQELGDRLQETTKVMQEANRHVGDRLDNAARVVGEVQGRLGKMDEATQRVLEVGKSIASLQEILRSPKLRGNLGELFLGDLLAQVLPKGAYELQYLFKSGEKVDAVIRSAQGIVPIDSKFPLENFVRIQASREEEEKKALRKSFVQDVRRHIDGIAQKYIRTDEGTLDLALMYIPAENVYYEVILRDETADLLRYAQEKKVFPVSPNSFYAYLQTIAIGLKGMQIEEGARRILDDVSRLQREFERFGEDFRKIGVHLSNARGSFESAEKRHQRLGERLETLGVEPSQELRVLKGGEET